ncbi:hypothetical protein GJU43_07240 [Flavobacterium sp. LC2016-23]|uniref:hypothetical protein n=1 Tax=Flavobacterium sp. LC2016-23 TaxID=2666330 RepID=UPI0012B0C382|nr:hypothetical protein [Flavobacterium sp. LC2016-23]MRX39065.1 hypothetical protein [Flavobacterium sp. LC2016-23]
MKENFKTAAAVITAVLIAAFFTGCQQDDEVVAAGSTTVSSAKEWFKEYEGKGDNYVYLQNLNYEWSGAIVKQAEDGTETIVVPIKELKINQSEIWQQCLYLYKLPDGSYKASVVEIYPDKAAPQEDQSMEGGNFNGYISVWDLKKGFVKAAQFKNNYAVEDGIVEVLDREDKATYKAPSLNPCFDGSCNDSPGGGNPIQLRTIVIDLLPGIKLNEVIIVKPKPKSDPSPKAVFAPRSPIIGGTTPGGYTSPRGGSGASSGGGTQATILVIEIEGEKIDPKEETKCFDKTKPAVLTVYVQQPNENTRDKIGANSVGHTFIGIQQGTIQRLIGFYPDSPNASLISSQKSELHDNSNTLYHVSISIGIDADKLSSIINYINDYSKTYDLNNYNCSDFAIGAAEKGGLKLPKTTGSYNAVIVNFKGRNPGDLGQDIRNMNIPGGVTKSVIKGNAPKKKGGC